MTADLQDLFDQAGRNPPAGAFDADTVLLRARRSRNRRITGVVAAAVVVTLTLVVGLANGYNGYLPTPQQHKFGGYETWLGTNRVQEDASEVMTKELLALLAKLAGGS